jgi:hypothetical protein
MVFIVKGVDRFTRGSALPHFTPQTAPGFCGVSRKHNQVSMRGMGGFPWSIAVDRSGLREVMAGASLPLAVLYPTITERNLRSRGQTFHSVTGALSVLWSVSDTNLRDWWVFLAAAGAKFHSGQRGWLRCVSFPRSGCRADVNSRQNWAIFLKQCQSQLALSAESTVKL